MLSEIYKNDLNNMKFPSLLMILFKISKILNLPYSDESLSSIIEEKSNYYIIANDILI